MAVNDSLIYLCQSFCLSADQKYISVDVSYTSAISLNTSYAQRQKNKRIIMKNQALGTELPGQRAKTKSPQRLIKSDVYVTSRIFICTIFLKLMTWSRLVTMETGVIYLPPRRNSTDTIRTGFLMKQRICLSFIKGICGKKTDEWNRGIGGNILNKGTWEQKGERKSL